MSLPTRIYTFTNDKTNNIYGIDADIVAKNYADYYNTKYGEDWVENYKTMIRWFDEKDYDFSDWAKNNMNYEDVKDDIFIYGAKNKDLDMEEIWANGDVGDVNG